MRVIKQGGKSRGFITWNAHSLAHGGGEDKVNMVGSVEFGERPRANSGSTRPRVPLEQVENREPRHRLARRQTNK